MRPPLSLYQLSPLPRLSSDTLIMLHTFTFEVVLHAESFYKHCQGSQPGNQNVENGTGKRRLGGGGLIYIQDHTGTDAAPQAKLKFKRNPPKNQSRGLAEGKPARPADFGQRGTSSTHAHLCQHMQKCKNETQTHTLQPGCGWDV